MKHKFARSDLELEGSYHRAGSHGAGGLKGYAIHGPAGARRPLECQKSALEAK
jgi:hypothetical protein